MNIKNKIIRKFFLEILSAKTEILKETSKLKNYRMKLLKLLK